ncbi:RidA family protein [Sedimentibacter hydroxybenzoicus DSM 7310]|uniref:RidA family protein n=1 Tax=Sedimentibacter hydroxybenzoicus DSM 7310 TaxID=1123245 RepID=A0A974GX87_SEDHY|nr:Rid family hydrolase [Sedimentibacter hydroxybenzoicus]NYB75278.1 RidA family protein [Sedimentibacter hydroxybenzoicus DSM 7310]
MIINRYDVKKRASRVVECNGVLYFEIHVAAAAQKEPMTMYEQARALLCRYDELLEQFDSDKKHILRADIFIREASMIDDFNKAWEEWVEDGFQPARATSTGMTAPECFLVGIVMTAALK